MVQTITRTETLAPVAQLVERLTEAGGFADATLTQPRPDTIRLLAGVPDRSALPTEEIARAYARLQAEPDRLVGSFQYSDAQGILSLRRWIAEREGVSPERIVVTTGGQQGLSLVVNALIDDGNAVAVDNPVWPLFLDILALKTKNVMPIPVQADGLAVDELERELRAGRRIRAVYTVPDFHNPTQVSLSESKRTALATLSEEYGFWVIADNPYRELHFGDTARSTAEFTQRANVVHVNSFSKTLGPGLRLGWLVLPERVTADVVRMRNRNDSQTSTFTQQLVAEVLEGEPEFFDANLRRARALYRSRATALVDALQTQLPGVFETEVPEGGYFLWARLTDDTIDSQRLAEAAVAAGVRYQPGAHFASGPGTDADRYLRFAYGDNSAQRLDEAVSRLASAYRSL